MASETATQMATSKSPRFIFPAVHENPTGWGPCEVPEQFKDTPYQPFSKGDHLGKVKPIHQQVAFTCLVVCRWPTGPGMCTPIGVQQVSMFMNSSLIQP